MRNFEQPPSSQMGASERMDELCSVVAYALIRIFVSSGVEPTVRQGTEPQKCTDKASDRVDGQPASQA